MTRFPTERAVNGLRLAEPISVRADPATRPTSAARPPGDEDAPGVLWVPGVVLSGAAGLVLVGLLVYIIALVVAVLRV